MALLRAGSLWQAAQVKQAEPAPQVASKRDGNTADKKAQGGQ